MNLSQEHINFYREKKVPVPEWAKKWASARKYPWKQAWEIPGTDINRLINKQIEKYDARLEARNLCALIKNAERLYTTPHVDPVSPEYYDRRTYLWHLAFAPCGTSSKRRISYARKWFTKLYGGLTT